MRKKIMQERTQIVECNVFHHGMSVLEASLRNTEGSESIISGLLKDDRAPARFIMSEAVQFMLGSFCVFLKVCDEEKRNALSNNIAKIGPQACDTEKRRMA